MRSTVIHEGNLRTENIIQMLQRRLRTAANGVCERKACLLCWSEEGKKQLLDYMLLLHYVMSPLEIISSFSRSVPKKHKRRVKTSSAGGLK